ncbi:MAG TPA: putative lipid II flippase FtsW [bacterium]|nr:putative lipid II flippase FtsW [bacterium]
MSGLRRYDYMLFLPALMLAVIGLVIVYSASATLAREKLGGEYFFLVRHAVYFGAGIVACLVFAHVPYSMLGKLSPLIVFVTLVALALVFVPHVGQTRGGATRWIGVGPFTFQPSEMAKVALVVYLARYASRERDLTLFTEGYVKPGIVAGLLILPILAQPDFGTTVILSTTFLLVLYCAGTRAIQPLALFAAAVPIAGFLIFHSDYRRRRLLAFMNPWSDVSHDGFQVIQSMLSFHGGGVLGRGLGEGRQKLFFLPEAHSDFVLAVVGEELGWIGVAVVFGCFALLISRGYQVAMRQGDPFGRLLAFGITTLLGLQAAINGAVVLGLLPTKGLTLPFVSYGGTSLMVTLGMVGILMNVSAHTDLESAPDRERKGTALAMASGAFMKPGMGGIS